VSAGVAGAATGTAMGAVLVTGAASGIGLATVQALLAQGVPVWAGVRNEADQRRLRHEGALPLMLDVRDAAQVQAAAAAVAAAAARGQPLAGLVHNAGVGGIGVLQSWSDAELADLFDTNVFGVHRLTRALLPLLLAARGRIVCVGSMGGSITHPFYGPYTMSKHALEAYASCLRQELAPFGVAVAIVQPGAVATAIGDKGQAGNVVRLRATPPPFEAMAAPVLHALLHPQPVQPDQPEGPHNRRAAPPSAVATRLLQALQMAEPPLRHLVGTRWEGERVIDTLIDRLLDAAASPAHGLTADDLAARIAARVRARDSGGGAG
jgi:NAD(P)-dependent dehydrogenase (short-subunit alcohol dehydrogenase family)